LFFKNINCGYSLFIHFYSVITDTLAEKTGIFSHCFHEVLSITFLWPLLPHPDTDPSLFKVMTLCTTQHSKLLSPVHASVPTVQA
jgi:hypothetical protein